ncbi:short-chain dehydrogenase/reductase [Aspergillus heteromorphus CBS 117.55]|uniref:Short-chain dehydrogenase/reductase n=1 Tax=Aspergillus heteromorphus CBS 117.55 TaxID=1448321 RepID=A0A317WAZ9_9EURO|nr:short-chain dehydrogenase/reductase [Aspergillus heteromorphus CBS 117.55]PWY83369.1 short-chain dehydrogenase/reductase [Aspergillus heteromorphus CBS 117.55]
MAPPVEFPITPSLGTGLRLFFHSQLFITPPLPTHSFANQTVIVTGSNTGLGLEAARHFYRLNCARLILAVRTVAKGEAAKEDIVSTVKQRADADAIEVWPLDMSSTASTLAFAERVKTELPRVDVLVENAGINTADWTLVEGYEQAVQVNVLNTFLLALSLLPKLTDTKTTFPDSHPHLVIVSSEAHRLTKFPEINAPDLYAKLNDQAEFSQQPRYQATKLIEILFTRELVARRKTASPPAVIINVVNPGLCTSNLDRRGPQPPLLVRIVRRILDRTTEVGGRTFVLAASAPVSSHGELQSDGANQDVESWIYTEVGIRAQRKVFEQTWRVLEMRKPGIGQEVGL